MIVHIDLLTRDKIVILTDSFQDSDSFHALTHFPFTEKSTYLDLIVILDTIWGILICSYPFDVIAPLAH